MNDALVVRSDHGPIAVVTLNRPRVLNAVNAAMAQTLIGVLQAADADPEVHAIVVTGAGRAFCAGGDLREMADSLRQNREIPPLLSELVRTPPITPVIAAVNGLAYGGGLEIVLASDLVIAGRSSSFALPEAKRGIMASAGGLVRLPLRVGVGHALWMAMSGEAIDAASALSWGLADWVVDDGDVLRASLEIGAKIARNPAGAVSAAKTVVYRRCQGRRPEEDIAWEINGAQRSAVLASADAARGVTAFGSAEHRDPRGRRDGENEYSEMSAIWGKDNSDHAE